MTYQQFFKLLENRQREVDALIAKLLVEKQEMIIAEKIVRKMYLDEPLTNEDTLLRKIDYIFMNPGEHEGNEHVAL